MGNLNETLLAKIGTTQELLNKYIESKRGHHRPLARLRFDMTLSQAYAKILESYMYEVQSRDCYYENDEYVAEAMYEIARNLIKKHPKKGVLLNGFCGNGKTTLAKGILKAIQDLNKDKHFKWDGGEATIADMTTRIVNAVDLCHLAQAMGLPVFKPAKMLVLVKNKQAMRARFFFWGKGLRGSMPLNPLMKQQAV